MPRIVARPADGGVDRHAVEPLRAATPDPTGFTLGRAGW